MKPHLLVAALLFLLGGSVRADLPPVPGPSKGSDRPGSPAPAEKACAAATGLLVFALGAAAAWRLSRRREAGKAGKA